MQHKHTSIDDEGNESSIEVQQILFMGKPALKTISRTRGGWTLTSYYAIQRADIAVLKRMLPPDPGQYVPNPDRKTWLDFFQYFKDEETFARLERSLEMPVPVVMQIEIEHHEGWTRKIEQVVADNHPAIRVTTESETDGSRVECVAFAFPVPPLDMLPDPSRMAETWEQISKAGAPKHIRELGITWQPQSVTLSKYPHTYQDYAAWKTVYNRARNS